MSIFNDTTIQQATDEIFNDTPIQHRQWWAIQWHNNTTYLMMSYLMTQQYNIANDELFNDTPIQHRQRWAFQWHTNTT